MLTLIATLLRVFVSVSDADADALRSTAPDDLKTIDVAREHLADARAVAVVTGMDPDLLLSISWHESRFDDQAITREPGGKISCGVMTAEPTHSITECQRARHSRIAGYVEGAKHLAGWIAASRGHLRMALLGYAGGYVGIEYCSDNRHPRDYRCWTPEVFVGRARRIRAAIARAARNTGADS